QIARVAVVDPRIRVRSSARVDHRGDVVESAIVGAEWLEHRNRAPNAHADVEDRLATDAVAYPVERGAFSRIGECGPAGEVAPRRELGPRSLVRTILNRSGHCHRARSTTTTFVGVVAFRGLTRAERVLGWPLSERIVTMCSPPGSM